MSFKINIKPKKNYFKRFVVKAGFLALGRAIESTSYFEKDVIAEIKDWTNGFSFSMNVMPLVPNLTMIKKEGHLKMQKNIEQPDLIVEIKNLATAFKMITTQLGVHHVYANHKIGLIGNIADSMKFTRIAYIVEAYLFPKFLNRQILKLSPEMGLKKQINRLHIYTVGMLFGR